MRTAGRKRGQWRGGYLVAVGLVDQVFGLVVCVVDLPGQNPASHLTCVQVAVLGEHHRLVTPVRVQGENRSGFH